MGAVRFPNAAAFTTWHDAACAARGIPRPGRNAATGAVEVDACWTTAWVEPRLVNGQIVVELPDADIAADPTLNALPRVTYDPETARIGAVPLEFRKPKPATVTIDGITYSTGA
jgi:hypothetical protein